MFATQASTSGNRIRLLDGLTNTGKATGSISSVSHLMNTVTVRTEEEQMVIKKNSDKTEALIGQDIGRVSVVSSLGYN